MGTWPNTPLLSYIRPLWAFDICWNSGVYCVYSEVLKMRVKSMIEQTTGIRNIKKIHSIQNNSMKFLLKMSILT